MALKMAYNSGQIIATWHDLGLQKVAEEGTSPYFREIQGGEVLIMASQPTLPNVPPQKQGLIKGLLTIGFP